MTNHWILDSWGSLGRRINLDDQPLDDQPLDDQPLLLSDQPQTPYDDITVVNQWSNSSDSFSSLFSLLGCVSCCVESTLALNVENWQTSLPALALR